MKTLSVAILTGGKSSRMGQNKAHLIIHDTTFIKSLIHEFSEIEDLFLSVDKKETYDFLPIPLVEDDHQNIGPIEGIRQSLKFSKNDYVFVCAVDMPFLSKQILDYFERTITDDLCDAYLFSDGRHLHTLCAVYHKRLVPKIEQSIAKKQYSIRSFLDEQRIQVIPISETSLQSSYFQNINTPEEYLKIKKTL